ncbi:MAG: class I SAM-dependent methyltransferase [Lachnospiraceae bacterium]
MKQIADLVSPGNIVADIGTDHGHVPIYLLQNNICPKVYAMDLSRNSLNKAIKSAGRFGLTGRMECRLSDGLEKLSPGEARTIIISGMGGILMTRILSARPDVVSGVEELILSPHRDAALVREFLENNNFRIIFDDVIRDKKKEYVILKAINKSG